MATREGVAMSPDCREGSTVVGSTNTVVNINAGHNASSAPERLVKEAPRRGLYPHPIIKGQTLNVIQMKSERKC